MSKRIYDVEWVGDEAPITTNMVMDRALRMGFLVGAMMRGRFEVAPVMRGEDYDTERLSLTVNELDGIPKRTYVFRLESIDE